MKAHRSDASGPRGSPFEQLAEGYEALHAGRLYSSQQETPFRGHGYRRAGAKPLIEAATSLNCATKATATTNNIPLPILPDMENVYRHVQRRHLFQARSPVLPAPESAFITLNNWVWENMMTILVTPSLSAVQGHCGPVTGAFHRYPNELSETLRLGRARSTPERSDIALLLPGTPGSGSTRTNISQESTPSGSWQGSSGTYQADFQARVTDQGSDPDCFAAIPMLIAGKLRASPAEKAVGAGPLAALVESVKKNLSNLAHHSWRWYPLRHVVLPVGR